MENITYLIGIGVLAGVILFYYRLYDLDRYLKHHHQEIWHKFGFGNKRLHLLGKVYRLKKLAIEYQADDKELNRLLNNISFFSKLLSIAIIVLLFSIVIFDVFD